MKSVSTLLETGYNPQWYVKPWRRFLRRTERKLDILERRTLRFAARQQAALRRWRLSQYYVSNAAYDAYRAARLNEDIVGGILIAGLLIGYVAVSSTANVLYFLSEAIMNVTGVAGLAIIPVLMLMMVGFGFLIVWLVAAITASLMQALIQGLNRKLYRSLRESLVYGYRHGLRLITAWVVSLLLTFVPIGLLAMLYAATFLFQPIELRVIVDSIPYAIIGGLIWLLYCAMHYALIPVVAVFEHGRTMGQVIARSHSVPLRRGRLFLLGLHFALVGVIALLYGLAWLINLVFPIGVLGTMLLGGFGLLLGYYAILTVFYRKRRLARA